MNEDEKEIERVVDLFYACISGPKEQLKEIEKLKDIFYEQNQITIIKHDKTIVDYCLNEYITRIKLSLGPIDFFEDGYSNKIEIVGEIAIIQNKYRAFSDLLKKVEIKKGNSIIIMAKNGKEWKIKSMIWEDEIA